MRRFLAKFIRSEDGPTSVEYAVMLAMIIAACLSAVATVGTPTKVGFENANEKIGAAMTAS